MKKIISIDNQKKSDLKSIELNTDSLNNARFETLILNLKNLKVQIRENTTFDQTPKSKALICNKIDTIITICEREMSQNSDSFEKTFSKIMKWVFNYLKQISEHMYCVNMVFGTFPDREIKNIPYTNKKSKRQFKAYLADKFPKENCLFTLKKLKKGEKARVNFSEYIAEVFNKKTLHEHCGIKPRSNSTDLSEQIIEKLESGVSRNRDYIDNNYLVALIALIGTDASMILKTDIGKHYLESRLKENVIPFLQDSKHILGYGCGSAQHESIIARSLKEASVLGIDRQTDQISEHAQVSNLEIEQIDYNSKSKLISEKSIDTVLMFNFSAVSQAVSVEPVCEMAKDKESSLLNVIKELPLNGRLVISASKDNIFKAVTSVIENVDSLEELSRFTDKTLSNDTRRELLVKYYEHKNRKMKDTPQFKLGKHSTIKNNEQFCDNRTIVLKKVKAFNKADYLARKDEAAALKREQESNQESQLAQVMAFCKQRGIPVTGSFY